MNKLLKTFFWLNVFFAIFGLGAVIFLDGGITSTVVMLFNILVAYFLYTVIKENRTAGKSYSMRDAHKF